MKKYILTLASFLAFISVNAQINKEIKKQSDQNQQDRNTGTTNKTTQYDNNNYDDSDDGFNGYSCGEACIPIIFDLIVGLSDEQRRVVESDAENDRITSFQATMDAGLVPNYSKVLIPRIRGNYGIFSTELRVFDNVEKRLQTTEHYSTFDWQMLIINLSTNKAFNLSIGTGFMKENYSGIAFHEWASTMDIYFKEKWRINLEGRTATDYKTHRNIRREATGGVYYAFKQTPKLSLYASLKGYTAHYYEVVSLNSLMFGTSLTLY